MAKKAEGENGGEKGQSKMGAVREALAELGADAKPADIVDFAKRKFGVEISAKQASVYKSQLRAKAGGGAAKGGRRRQAEPEAEAPARTAASSPPEETPLLRQLRELVGMIGKDGVHRLIDGL
jgi:hypothetical protein